MKIRIKNARRNQYETLYIIYMMAGSYFGKCVFPGNMEIRLKMYYMEMNEGDQVKTESNVEKQFRKAVRNADQLCGLMAEFRVKFSDDMAYAYFETGFCDVMFAVSLKGKCQIWVRGQAA